MLPGWLLAGVRRWSLVWAFIYGAFRCARAVLCLVLKLTVGTYVPIGAAGREDARTLVPGYANVSLGTSDRIR